MKKITFEFESSNLAEIFCVALSEIPIKYKLSLSFVSIEQFPIEFEESFLQILNDFNIS